MNIFVIIDGDQRGPLTTSELRGLLESGQIQPDTPALREGDENWSMVSKFARLPDGDAPAGGTESGGVAPMASVARDVRNLKRNSSATAGELRGFMREMRGKSPAEMLGAIAQSTLVRSLMVSTASIMALMLTLTAVPYFMADEETEKASSQPESSEATAPSANPTPTTPVPPVPSNPSTKVPDVLGVNGEKKGKPAEVNPFENKSGPLDDPLGDLKID